MKISRRELYPALLVLVLTGAIVLMFPFSAFSFRPMSAPQTHEPSAAFVTLTVDEREAALKAAKTAWQSDSLEDYGVRIRLPLGELPDEEQGALLDDQDVSCGTVPFEPVGSRLSAWMPSLKAPAPARFEPEPDERNLPAFPREELLRIDGL